MADYIKGKDGKFHLLYLITNKLDGKFYVGKHSTFNMYDNYWGSGDVIKHAIKKYGKESFYKEILGAFPSELSAYAAEHVLINTAAIDDDQCYNITMGGKIPPSQKGKHKSEDHKQKLSAANKGKNTGKHHTEHSRKKMSCNNAWKDKHLSKDHRRKISTALMGHGTTEKMRKQISNTKKEYFKKEENRKKQSASNKGQIPWNKGKKGKHLPEETRKNMRVSQQRRRKSEKSVKTQNGKSYD